MERVKIKNIAKLFVLAFHLGIILYYSLSIMLIFMAFNFVAMIHFIIAICISYLLIENIKKENSKLALKSFLNDYNKI